MLHHMTVRNHMKKIEAVISRSSLDDFHQCLWRLGCLGFDLSEEYARKADRQSRSSVTSTTPSRLKVEFAVLDEEAKPTVHAVLESVHPDSVAIFKFEQDTLPQSGKI
jgi:nitrogen regulatory protein PII